MTTITITTSTSTAATTELIFNAVVFPSTRPVNKSLNCDGIRDTIFAIKRIETPFPIVFSVSTCASHIMMPVPAVIVTVIAIMLITLFPEIRPLFPNPIAIQQLCTAAIMIATIFVILFNTFCPCSPFF